MTRSLVAALLCAGVAACGGGGSQDLCALWTCSGHGHCEVTDSQPGCICDTGFRPTEDGTQCLVDIDDPCQGITCSGHGRCRKDAQDQPYCECDNGWWPSEDGLDCLENTCLDPCGPLGCCGGRCCQLRPSNSGDVGSLRSTGLVRSASGSFDTETDCQAGSALGDCEPVAPVGGTPICVCRLDELTISATLRVQGPAVLAVLAQGTIRVNGALDLAAAGETGGPGAAAQTTAAESWYGGRGGSLGTRGGSSGDAARSTPALVPLLGGQAGQAGCGGRLGGGGGGSVQLSAGDSITVSGSIDAGGGGGQGGQADSEGTCMGGAGGGSGGGVLLEAPSVTVTGRIAVNGGGGGGGGNNFGAAGGGGQDASGDDSPASGGEGRDGASCALYQAIIGGDGGAGAVGNVPGGDGQAYDTNQCDPVPYVGGGGGGGGSGRIRVNTLEGCDCSGSFSVPPSPGGIQGN